MSGLRRACWAAMSGFDIEGTEVGAGCRDGEANADNETLKQVASFYYDPKVLEAEDEESNGTAVPTEVDQQELKDLLKRYQEDLKEQTQ